MKTLKALIDYIKDDSNDLKGTQREFVIDNLQSIERQQKKSKNLLQMVLDDFEDGNLSQSVINKIKNELAR